MKITKVDKIPETARARNALRSQYSIAVDKMEVGEILQFDFSDEPGLMNGANQVIRQFISAHQVKKKFRRVLGDNVIYVERLE